MQDQRKAGVRITGDGKADESGVYPKPMFDFAERRGICLEGMKKAYAVGLYGDDKRVIDGTWRALFPDEAEGPTEGQAFPDAMVGNGNGTGNASSAKGKGKVQRKPGAKDIDDGTVAEEGAEAAETGGEGKGGDVKKKGTKRAARSSTQGTLDALVVKRAKK